MKIIELQAENVKRLRAVEIRPDPDGNLIVIGGRNRQGKTCVLDSIMMALGGQGTVCGRPVRDGETRAEVTVKLDDLSVTRIFNKDGGSRLKVQDASGAAIPSPQTLLDKLVGKLAFDPLAFTRMAPGEQAQTLRELVGLDFSELDEKRGRLYEARTEVNREVKHVASRLRDLPHHKDAPAEPIDVAAELAELKKAQLHNEEVAQLSREAAQAEEEVRRVGAKIIEIEEQISRLGQDLEDKRVELKKAADALYQAQSRAKKAKPMPVEPIEQKIASANAENAKVTANKARKDAAQSLAVWEKKSRELTDAMERLDADKERQLAAAKYPVEGICFTDACVLLNGVPFEQASSAEQLQVSAAMGLALNPKLRVLLIREGSLLDNGSLVALARFAAQNDAQIWLEKVTEGEASVVIEDGAVIATDDAYVERLGKDDDQG